MTKLRFKPMVYLAIINILSFFILFLYTEAKEEKLVYIGVALAGVNIAVYAILYYFEIGDTYLFLTSAMLVSIGLVMLYRIGLVPLSMYHNLGYTGIRQSDIYSFEAANKQFIWFCIGIFCYLITALCFGRFKFWNRLYVAYIAACFGIIVVTFLLAPEINGARNWLFIGPVSIQTSEIVKIVYCLALACGFSRIPTDLKKDKRQRICGIPKDELMLCIFAYSTMGALMIAQKEWGTALLMFFIYFGMTFVYRTNKLLKFINFAGIVMVILFGYAFLTSDIGQRYAGHITVRIDAWLDPWKDPANVGYQATHGLMAIANGGYFGTGLGLGFPYVVPSSFNDFIFTSICEEMGIFTGIAIILLYFLLVYRGVKVAIKSDNEFLKAVCMALVLSLGFQTFLIVGGVINLIPLTGITLPFISSGGSSMLVSYIMLGILTSFSFVGKKVK